RAALPADLDVSVVHEAARPLVSSAVVERAIAAAARGLGVVVAVPVTDTIKEVAADGRIVGTPDRSRLWAAQTPQAFPAALLRAAYQRALQEGISATDDAALVAHCGGTVVILPGEPGNLKITTEADLAIAAALLDRCRSLPCAVSPTPRAARQSCGSTSRTAVSSPTRPKRCTASGPRCTTMPSSRSPA
ncbi:MAG: hypothetical protein FIB01_16505, partial [Gemmatimonadetes bacterium]|nr:hypothetical protein [Gemmatimonadota bacterium]